MEWLRCQSWWSFGILDYGQLVAAYAKVGDCARAQAAVDALLDAGLQPNAIVYTALMDAYARHGSLSQAEGILARMETEGMAPSLITYMTLLCAYGKVRLSLPGLTAPIWLLNECVPVDVGRQGERDGGTF